MQRGEKTSSPSRTRLSALYDVQFGVCFNSTIYSFFFVVSLQHTTHNNIRRIHQIYGQLFQFRKNSIGTTTHQPNQLAKAIQFFFWLVVELHIFHYCCVCVSDRERERERERTSLDTLVRLFKHPEKTPPSVRAKENL